MSSHLPLSVVVIALNEEKRIGDCLSSVAGLSDDIVVVDAGSTDATAAIAVRHGARVLRRAWTGFSDQKNFGDDAARHDWILSLDADERVTPRLAAALRSEFSLGPRHDAYALKFRSHLGPYPVRFGAWNPEWHVRLFDRRRFRWNADEVHEGLRGDPGATEGRLPGLVLHFTADSRAELAAKGERYGRLFAGKLRRQGRHPSWVKVWLNPPARFLRDYVLRAGVLDGAAGLAIAWEAARYTHLKYRLAIPPEPRSRPVWRAPLWVTATAAIVFAALLAVSSRHSPPENHPEFAAWFRHIDGLFATDDGFDNHASIAGRSLMVDQEVLQ